MKSIKQDGKFWDDTKKYAIREQYLLLLLILSLNACVWIATLGATLWQLFLSEALILISVVVGYIIGQKIKNVKGGKKQHLLVVTFLISELILIFANRGLFSLIEEDIVNSIISSLSILTIGIVFCFFLEKLKREEQNDNWDDWETF